MKATKLIFAALFAGALLASCAPKEEQELNSELPQTVVDAQPVFVSINASKAVDTKALAIVGTALKSTWEDGDVVGVYKPGDVNTKYGTLSPVTFGSSSTTLEGTLNGVATGDDLFLLYPDRSWSYDGQEGTLENVSENFDYSTATVTVTAADATHISTDAAAFKNQQAIVKLNLKEKGTGNAVKAVDFVILSKNKKLVRSHDLTFAPEGGDNLPLKLAWDSPLSELTLAVATVAGEADDYGFFATTLDSGYDRHVYEYVRGDVTFEAGKYYNVNLNNMEEVHYVAAGSPASVFGAAWDATAAANEMTFDGSYIWKYLPISDPCELQFKVVRNGTYYPEGDETTNKKAIAAAPGGITIRIDPFTKDVTYELNPDPSTLSIYTVAGAIAGVTAGGEDDAVFVKTWDPFQTVNDMTESAGVYTKTFTAVPAGTEMRFKVVKNRDWSVSYGGEGDTDYYYKVLADGDVTVSFDPAGPTISVAGPAPTVSYTVAGSESVFGTNWDPTDTANDMVINTDGTYLKTYSVTTLESIEFKIVKDHAFGDPEVNNWPKENFIYNIPHAGTLHIWFDPNEKWVEAWMDDERYYIAGDFNSWNTTANLMTAQPDGTYKAVINNVAAGDHEYKYLEGCRWQPGANSVYAVSSPCDLEFTMTPSTRTVTVKELRATLYFRADTPVTTKASICSSLLGTEDWPGTEITEREAIAGAFWYKYVVPASLLWGKHINFYFHGGGWATAETVVDFADGVEAYYFTASKDVVATQLSARPAEPSFTIDGTFTDWNDVRGNTLDDSGRATLLKAYSDGTYLYCYLHFTYDSGSFDLTSTWRYFRMYVDKDNDATTGFDTSNWLYKGSDYISGTVNSILVYVAKDGSTALADIDNAPSGYELKVVETSASVLDVEFKMKVADLGGVTADAIRIATDASLGVHCYGELTDVLIPTL